MTEQELYHRSLPLLRLPASANQVESERNLINFRQAIETYVRREYGDIANIFTLMEYLEYPEVDYDPEELTKRRPNRFEDERG